ncbi:MAG TPA: SDR family NAD(P)-dependent oxidoreductase, partial [Thermoanaerobaculia bacterium]
MSDRTTLVTGASSGIGRELALAAARDSATVVLVARRRERLEEVVAGLAADHGIRTRVIVADLGTGEGVRAVEEGTADLDVGLLVAAAGFGTAGPFLRSDLARELDLLAVNCRAVVALAHHFGRRFAARGRGGM